MNHVSAEKCEGQAEETLGIADIIGVLGNEFSNIYLVDCESQNIEIYRYENEKVGVKEVLHQKQPYKAAIQNYIETNVFSEDKNECAKIIPEISPMQLNGPPGASFFGGRARVQEVMALWPTSVPREAVEIKSHIITI